jgi:cytochrome c oxidase cbb3-type subunit III
MNSGRIAFALAPLVLTVSGCSVWHGEPKSSQAHRESGPDFVPLYRRNCAGCHGPDGTGGAAMALADPVYLAWVDDTSLRKVIANGSRGTPMAAFSRKAGGMLTEPQVDSLVRGLRAWARPQIPAAMALPPYAEEGRGDPQRGAQAEKIFCAGCHGDGGKGAAKAGSIVDPAYLSLVSAQGLRTAVVVGRRELGAPDFRSNIPARAMTSQEISDVVAWLLVQRPASAPPMRLSKLE